MAKANGISVPVFCRYSFDVDFFLCEALRQNGFCFIFAFSISFFSPSLSGVVFLLGPRVGSSPEFLNQSLAHGALSRSSNKLRALTSSSPTSVSRYFYRFFVRFMDIRVEGRFEGTFAPRPRPNLMIKSIYSFLNICFSVCSCSEGATVWLP